jgi:hypothetical protein
MITEIQLSHPIRVGLESDLCQELQRAIADGDTIILNGGPLQRGWVVCGGVDVVDMARKPREELNGE